MCTIPGLFLQKEIAIAACEMHAVMIDGFVVVEACAFVGLLDTQCCEGSTPVAYPFYGMLSFLGMLLKQSSPVIHETVMPSMVWLRLVKMNTTGWQ